MSRHTVLILSIAFCIGIFSSFAARADTVTQARKAIQAAYDREDAAVSRKDVPGILVNCAPNFQFITQNGMRGSLADARQGLTAQFQTPSSFVAKTTLQKLTLQGNKAVVTVKEYQMRTVVPKAPHVHPHKIVTVSIDEDTWVKHGNRWLREISKNISQKQTLDGKPIS
jgi:hypothetical protein